MPTLRLTYSDVYTKVAEYLGMGSAPTGTDLIKVQDLTKRGYRRFLMPIDASDGKTYRWYFMQRTATLSVVSGTDTYKLPLGFSTLITPFTHTTPVSYNPTQKSLAFIYLQKSQTTGTGYPRWFALKSGNYDTITGQQDEVIFSPIPSASLTYYYTYVFTPSAPEEDDDVFVGDDYASECILECALAVAEFSKYDSPNAPNPGVHAREADRLVQAAIGEDKRNYFVPNMGQITDGKCEEYIRSATVYDKTSTQVLPEP